MVESLSLFQSLVSMWHRCIKTRTKNLSWSITYVACTYLHLSVYIGISLIEYSFSLLNPILPLRLLESLAIKLATDL